MKKQIQNIEDYNIFTDENGNLTAELKVKSLKLADILEAEKDKSGCYIADVGVVRCKILKGSNEFIKSSTARKAMLYGQLLRIADYANGDWVRKENETYCFVYLYKNKTIKIGCNDDYYGGLPCFKSEELAQQAYNDNKELFDEFFSL